MSIEGLEGLLGSWPRFHPRQFRQLRQRPLQLLRGILYAFAEVALGIGQLFLAQENFRETKDGSEWRAQFVREMGH